MRIRPILISLCSLALVACGSESGEPGATDEPGKSNKGFDPPPVKDGYTRITAPVMTDLAPATDVMYCQFVQAPFDRDLDILDIGGYQSRAGHHAVAYATGSADPVGTSGPCNMVEDLSGGFLGGIGGEAGAGVELPDGVAFRLPKGSGIMLNTHFLNTTEETIDGETVIDVKFAEVDPTRKIASMYVNGDFRFTLPAGAPTVATAECSLPRDIDFILFTNHMHDYGVRAITELVRNDGTVELVHEDPTWTYEMQFKSDFEKWPAAEPFHVAAGETFRTRCEWNNTTGQDIAFPREMCIGFGFFLSDGSTAPVCANGSWHE